MVWTCNLEEKSMKKSLILSCLVLAFSLGVNAQKQFTIKGKILDSDSQIALPFAVIKVLDSKLGTYSDLNGDFSLTLDKDTSYIYVNLLGYVRDTFQVAACTIEDCVLTFAIKQDTEEISSVVIKATKVREYNCASRAEVTRLPVRSLNAIASVSYSRKRRKSKRTEPVYIDRNVQVHNTENYAPIDENEFKLVKNEPLSTVSVDVDKASYSNVRRFIESGSKPPKDAIRIEEMVNYFNYEYPPAEADAPIKSFTQLATCPWNKDNMLLQIGIKGKQLSEETTPNSNLVFLLDVSGSMQSRNKLELVKKSLLLLLDNLQPEDKIAIVVYAGNAGVVLPSTQLKKGKKDIAEALTRLRAGGSTAGGQGILLAYKIAEKNFLKDGNNRIVLCTDGDFNVGVSSNGALEDLISKKKESGVFLSVLGFGMGNYKDDRLEILADKGNGNYAYIDTYKEAKKVFMNEVGGTMYTVAKDVKIQVEFNPQLISGYRLIGYENRKLNNEDFNDDKKDAGEMGENQSVTFLYELIPSDNHKEIKKVKEVDDLKYQVTTPIDSFNAEYLTVKFRYKEPKGVKSKLIEIYHTNKPQSFESTDDNLQFAACVAMFGMMLRESEYAKSMTYRKLFDLLDETQTKNMEEREEFVQLVKKAKGL
ncbi:MAG: von Willebrand factor type A domain-containing protein [Bacteroidia bacterium]|nr:von Willebrand factor type A domain-containing protein [Bacteroidia bacterium]